jgi:hypothetical protein
MNKEIKAKATSLEKLHKMSADMIALSNQFCRKYPEFDAEVSISHKDFIVVLKIFRPDEQAEEC